MISFEWKDLAWIMAVAVGLGGLLLAFLRFKLAGDFAKDADVKALGTRLTMMEERLARMPSHDDLRVLQHRVGELERGVAVVGEKVSSLNEIMVRVERQQNLMAEHLLREAR